MDKINGAEAAVRMLQANGVKHIFGLCGDTSLPFYDALYKLDHGMTHVLTRDERSAAYMADGYARVTGRPGAAHICLPYDVMRQTLDAADIWAQPGQDRFPA